MVVLLLLLSAAIVVAMRKMPGKIFVLNKHVPYDNREYASSGIQLVMLIVITIGARGWSSAITTENAMRKFTVFRQTTAYHSHNLITRDAIFISI